VKLGGGSRLPLLWIPRGEFVMGSPPDELEREACEGPQHLVRLAGFWLSQTPITQAQWRAVADFWLEKQRRMIDQLNVCLGMQRLTSAKGLDVSPDEVIPCQVKPSGSMPAWPELPSPMQSENPSMQV